MPEPTRKRIHVVEQPGEPSPPATRQQTSREPVLAALTGDEPMTGAQASYLKTLSQEAGEEFDESLNKAQASERIDALQEKTGRGT